MFKKSKIKQKSFYYIIMLTAISLKYTIGTINMLLSFDLLSLKIIAYKEYKKIYNKIYVLPFQFAFL